MRPANERLDRPESPRIHGGTPAGEEYIAPRSEEPPRRPLPGEGGIVLLGLSIGILLMGVQLWLLTLAFDLYQLGEDEDTLLVALWSGLIFLGGLGMLAILNRRGGD